MFGTRVEKSDQIAPDNARLTDEELCVLHSQILREKDEPSESSTPIPTALVFLFGVLIFWGGGYLAKYSGGFRYDIYDPNGVEVVEPPIVAESGLNLGNRIYRKSCQACHQANGTGVPGSVPPLAGSSWVIGDEGRIVKILLNGLNGPIEVGGVAFNGNMPSYGENGANWDDAKIAAVATWVRQAWGNGASEVTPEVVAAIRAEIAGRNHVCSGDEILGEHPI
ncbi:MAG: cytochrome c [Verrucomicrobiota bacterium]